MPGLFGALTGTAGELEQKEGTELFKDVLLETSGSCLASALSSCSMPAQLVLELSNLGARITQVRTEHVGQIRISVFDELGDGGHDEVSALGDEESELAQDPAYGIDACGPCGEPS